MSDNGTQINYDSDKEEGEIENTTQEEVKPEPVIVPESKPQTEEPIAEDLSTNYRLILRNLRPLTKEMNIRSSLKPFGSIAGVQIIEDKYTHRCKGFAFVTFENEESYQKALDAKTVEILGNEALIDKPLTEEERDMRREQDYKTKIYVSNIPFEMKEEELRDGLNRYGTVKSISMIRNNKNQSNGYGFVEFENESTVEDLLEAQILKINGKLLAFKRLSKKSSTGNEKNRHEMRRDSRSDYRDRSSRDYSPKRHSYYHSYSSKRRRD